MFVYESVCLGNLKCVKFDLLIVVFVCFVLVCNRSQLKVLISYSKYICIFYIFQSSDFYLRNVFYTRNDLEEEM